MTSISPPSATRHYTPKEWYSEILGTKDSEYINDMMAYYKMHSSSFLMQHSKDDISFFNRKIMSFVSEEFRVNGEGSLPEDTAVNDTETTAVPGLFSVKSMRDHETQTGFMIYMLMQYHMDRLIDSLYCQETNSSSVSDRFDSDDVLVARKTNNILAALNFFDSDCSDLSLDQTFSNVFGKIWDDCQEDVRQNGKKSIHLDNFVSAYDYKKNRRMIGQAVSNEKTFPVVLKLDLKSPTLDGDTLLAKTTGLDIFLTRNIRPTVTLSNSKFISINHSDWVVAND